MTEKIWYCSLIIEALKKGLPVRIYDAKENGMGLQIATTKFDGFGWEAFEDIVEDEDIEKQEDMSILSRVAREGFEPFN